MNSLLVFSPSISLWMQGLCSWSYPFSPHSWLCFFHEGLFGYSGTQKGYHAYIHASEQYPSSKCYSIGFFFYLSEHLSYDFKFSTSFLCPSPALYYSYQGGSYWVCGTPYRANDCCRGACPPLTPPSRQQVCLQHLLCFVFYIEPAQLYLMVSILPLSFTKLHVLIAKSLLANFGLAFKSKSLPWRNMEALQLLPWKMPWI